MEKKSEPKAVQFEQLYRLASSALCRFWGAKEWKWLFSPDNGARLKQDGLGSAECFQ